MLPRLAGIPVLLRPDKFPPSNPGGTRVEPEEGCSIGDELAVEDPDRFCGCESAGRLPRSRWYCGRGEGAIMEVDEV